MVKFMVVLATGVMLLFLYFAAMGEINIIRSQRWPVTDAEAVDAYVQKLYAGGRSALRGCRYEYVPKLLYKYNVGGIDYSGTNISYFHEEISCDEAKAQKFLDDNITGKNYHIEVFYNPANPAESVMVKQAVSEGIWVLLFTASCAGGMLFGSYLILTKKGDVKINHPKRRNNKERPHH